MVGKMTHLRMLAALLLPLLVHPGLLPAQAGEQGSVAGQSAGQPRYYVSNELGLPLEEIGWYRRDEYSYVLKVSQEDQWEVRTLLAAGEVLKRWELAPSEEREYQGELISAIRYYDRIGRLREERHFQEGELASRTLYHYTPQGISYSETFDRQDKLLYTDRYRLARGGRLRNLERIGSDPQQQEQSFSLASGLGNLYEEQLSAGESSLVYRFGNDGRLLSKEQWQAGRLTVREQWSYAQESERPSSTTELDHLTGRRTVKIFDSQGQLLRQTVELEGSRQEEHSYQWNERGDLSQSIRRSAKGLERWNYRYHPDGELEFEEYRLRGALQKTVLYQEAGRVEELYREGELFLRITYQDEEKVKEEFLKDGVVIRVRIP